jgi:hypothetical protein
MLILQVFSVGGKKASEFKSRESESLESGRQSVSHSKNSKRQSIYLYPTKKVLSRIACLIVKFYIQCMTSIESQILGTRTFHCFSQKE